jgi:hypothetical protein
MDDIATEVARVESASQRAKNLADTADEDLRWLMSHKQGRRLMNSLLEVTAVFQSSYTGTEETFFREGARNVGLRYLAKITDLCPDHYVTMLKEHKENA